MDKSERFRQIIKNGLLQYTDIEYANGDFQNKPVFVDGNVSDLIV